MIEVENLTKHFGQIVAVNNLSFRVRKGEVLGFLGPNGAGKSTTLRMIAGYLQPGMGTVNIEGKNFYDDQISAKRKIGYMPETTPLYKEMTAHEYLMFIAEIHAVNDPEKRVAEVVNTTNLGSVRDQLIETISKGYRSRLNFAAAIIHDPPVLLLDEPTDGLDPNQKNEIRKLIKSLSREKAIIVSTHILEEVGAMCTRVIIISEGRMVLDSTPDELRNYSSNSNRVVVSIKSGDKQQVEKILSASLSPLGMDRKSFERFRIESDYDISSVNSLLLQNSINYTEIFYYDAPLDEAFSQMTITKE